MSYYKLSDDYKLSVIEEIMNWKSQNEDNKLYYIKCYLTGWVTEEQIHRITERDDNS